MFNGKQEKSKSASSHKTSLNSIQILNSSDFKMIKFISEKRRSLIA